MNALLPLLLVLQPTANSTIDAAIRANDALVRGNVRIVRKRGNESSRIDLAWERPKKALMRTYLGNSEQVVYLNDRTLVAYDKGLNEWIRRSPVKGGSLSERIASGVGQFEYVAQQMLDPAAMKTFLTSLKKGRLAATTSRQTVRLRQVLSKSRVVSFDFNLKTKLLTAATWRSPESTEVWQITYQKPKTVVFAPPKSATWVRAFTPPIEMPVFASKEAEATVHRMVKAYRGYHGGVVVATNDEGSVRMVYAGNRLKQAGKDSKWSYDGKTLRLTEAGKTRSIDVPRSELIDRLASLGRPMDPFLRSLAVRQVPFQPLLGNRVKAILGGQATVQGLPCTILNLVREGSRASLFVRPDGLVQSLSVESTDARGNVLASSSRRFAYGPLSPGETFR
ncbi:MAG TPA: hypothetical protein VGE01_08405 [Fimbriimonas sp.]